jgi:3D (Asp-Asp-Asp) domain-containing protein
VDAWGEELPLFKPPGPLDASALGPTWIDTGTVCRARVFPPSGAPRCPATGLVGAKVTQQTNAFGDALPVIPSGKRVQHGKVLYRSDFLVTLVSLPDGAPIAGVSLPSKLWGVAYPVFKSNRTQDHISFVSKKTAADGSFTIRLETRDPGKLTITDVSGIVNLSPLTLELKEAWYEDKFLITGYNVCMEGDFSGELVSANGLPDKHKKDFLFSATGVVMEGTGQATGGRYVQFVSMTTNWHRNAHGHPDYIADPTKVTFRYGDSVQGAYGPVVQGTSCAVDPNVIPPRSWVWIEDVGNRKADDTGSAIVGSHIDNFLGAGEAVADAWDNLTDRKVKYLGTTP